MASARTSPCRFYGEIRDAMALDRRIAALDEAAVEG